MKLGTINHNGVDTPVVATSDLSGVVTLHDVYASADLGVAPGTIRELLMRGPEELARVSGAVEGNEKSMIPMGDITWCPPVPNPSLMLGVAMNNGRLNDTAHVAPAGPMFFVKPQSSLAAHGDAVEIGDDYGFTFPELELAVVIGAPTRHVAVEDALESVAGYTIVNDVTSQGLKLGDSIAVDVSDEARATPGYEDYFSWRNSHGEGDNSVYFTYHARSKGSATFAPIGPFITTRDEIENPDDLSVRGFVDGELFAEDNTSSYTYKVAEIISWASRYFNLQTGDILFCGTAAKGTEKYPRAHHNVDMSLATPDIDIEIDGLGRLSNSVIHFTHPQS